MTWNWQKTLGGFDHSAATAATDTGSAGKALSKPKGRRAGPGTNVRPSSIIWRTAGLGNHRWADGLCTQVLDAPEYECPFCHGRGELASGNICPVCNGDGKVHVQPPAVKCAFCNGQGQVPPRSNLTCWVCKGRGLVSVVPPIQTCPDCQGRGRKPCASLYCNRCRGVGVVLAHGGS